MEDYWEVHPTVPNQPHTFDNESEAIKAFDLISQDPQVDIATVIHHRVVKRFVRGEDNPNTTGKRRCNYKNETDYQTLCYKIGPEGPCKLMAIRITEDRWACLAGHVWYGKNKNALKSTPWNEESWFNKVVSLFKRK